MDNYTELTLEELTKLASRREEDAQAELAYRYAMGVGTPKSAAKAAEWGEKAFSRGRTDIAPLLGRVFFNGGDDLAKDTAKAFKYFTEGANQGDAESICTLAIDYYAGKNGVERNCAKVYEYIFKVMMLGTGGEYVQSRARCHLGYMYANGCGVKKDLDEAVSWYLRAASKGYSDAYIGLVECFTELGDLKRALYYGEKACDSENEQVRLKAIELCNGIVRKSARTMAMTPKRLSDEANAIDREIHNVIRELHDRTDKDTSFDAEADRLVKNAETYARIGNYKRVFPAYERVTDEYPHDFRGWYNLARVFTDNFAVYSVFSVDDYGKREQAEYRDNMVYAQRTVDEGYCDAIENIRRMYSEGCVDLSVCEMVNTLYGIYAMDDCAEKAAEYARKYEEKITYLYENKPCVETALTLHLLLNVLNNDNIAKYNARVRQHNASLDQKVAQAVEDYTISLAQRMKIENPKDYETNDEALEDIREDAGIQAQIQEFRQSKKASFEYYDEISTMMHCDVYDSESFGAEKAYEGYKPARECEFNDGFVDFIVAFAEKCGIQMRGYSAFYSPQGREAYEKYISQCAHWDNVRMERFDKYISLREKYMVMNPAEDSIFVELAECIKEYSEYHHAFDKASASNVFKTVFKSKEAKEEVEETASDLENAKAKLLDMTERIKQRAREEIVALNEHYAQMHPECADYVITHTENILDEAVTESIEKLKA